MNYVSSKYIMYHLKKKKKEGRHTQRGRIQGILMMTEPITGAQQKGCREAMKCRRRGKIFLSPAL